MTYNSIEPVEPDAAPATPPKDNKDVVGNGCVRDRSGKLCMGRGKELKYGKNIWRE
jgi:hypothetical protein